MNRSWLHHPTERVRQKVLEKSELLGIALDKYFDRAPLMLVKAPTSVGKLWIEQESFGLVSRLLLVMITGGISILSCVSIFAVPPLPNCKNPQQLTLDSERLYCYSLAARSGDRRVLIPAINLVKSWSAENPLANNGHVLLNEWSEQLLVVTRRKLLADGDLPDAIHNLANIPPQSSVYLAVKQDVTRWQAQWQAGEILEDKLQKAIVAAKWEDGRSYLTKIRAIDHGYWRNIQYDRLFNQFVQQRESWLLKPVVPANDRKI